MIAAATLPKHNPNPAIVGGRTPFVRVRVGSVDVWQTGDRRLISCSMTLAEGKNNSSCEFTISDQTRQIANRYFAIIYKNNGLDPLTLPGSSTDQRNDKISNRGRSGGNDLSDEQKAQEAIAFFQEQGFTPYAVAAIVGTIQQESRFDPGIANPSSGAYGLFQWLGDRASGVPQDDFYGQLEFSMTDMAEDEGTQIAYIGKPSIEVFRDPNASESEIQDAVHAWIRWDRATEEGSRWDYAAQAMELIEEGPTAAQQKTSNSVEQAQNEPKKAATSRTSPSQAPTSAKVGQQITVELGFDGETYIAASFLHTSLIFDLFGPSTLTFSGQAASYVLARRIKNTAYTNLTLKQIAQQICDSYGLTLDMPQDGPTYEYIPQRGVSDYEFLLSECRRIGWRVRSVGNTLTIAPRSETIKDPGFVLVYGENLGTTFRVTHSAQSDSGGARASDPSSRSTSGQRKYTIDNNGKLVQVQTEVDTGTANATAETPDKAATTGHHISTLGTIVQKEDANAAENKENEKRLKGIKAEFSTPTTLEALVLDPDTTLYTAGFAPEQRQVDVTGQLVLTDGIQSLTSAESQDAAVADFLDRIWVVEKVTHTYNASGFVTTGSCYSPIKNRFPRQTSSERNDAVSDRPRASNIDGYIIPTTGIFTSPYGMRGNRLHAGIDIANDTGTSIWAAADGTIAVVDNDPGGYGNFIVITHADGSETLYGHLSEVLTSIGDTVTQGQEIAKMGSTGFSTGPHLHWEIRINGSPVNPADYVSLPGDNQPV